MTLVTAWRWFAGSMIVLNTICALTTDNAITSVNATLAIILVIMLIVSFFTEKG